MTSLEVEWDCVKKMKLILTLQLLLCELLSVPADYYGLHSGMELGLYSAQGRIMFGGSLP